MIDRRKFLAATSLAGATLLTGKNSLAGIS
ncbi:MAG: twin-arginine translocation signal domain-containing protein [Daejeonella sp.]